jgi:hypothetical protein
LPSGCSFIAIEANKLMNNPIWRIIRKCAEILSTLIVCFTTGTGIGFNLGEITARSWTRSAQIAFSEGAASIGGAVACVVGPFLYYFVLKQHVLFKEFATIVAVALVTGSLIALTGSELLTPIVPVLLSTVAAVIIRAQREDSERGTSPSV